MSHYHDKQIINADGFRPNNNQDAPAVYCDRGDVVAKASGGKTLVVDPAAWNDINFEGAQFAAGASAPDLVTLFGSGSVEGRGFDGVNTTEQLFNGAELLHDYVEGTDLSFHIHFMPTTNDAGNIKWQLEYSWQNVDGTFAAPTTISVVAAAGGTAWLHNKVAFADIDGTGKRIGSHFVFRLFRNPADDADTYAQDAVLISAGIHYQIDGIGSRGKTTK